MVEKQTFTDGVPMGWDSATDGHALERTELMPKIIMFLLLWKRVGTAVLQKVHQLARRPPPPPCTRKETRRKTEGNVVELE